MARGKASKSGPGIPQKHLHARISYLNQAAVYFASSEQKSGLLLSATIEGRQPRTSQSKKSNRFTYTESRNLSSQLKAVSLKSQIRLAPELKHSLCKRCNSPLIPAATHDVSITNDSRHGEKPWADVLVVACGFCGVAKRHLIGHSVGRELVARSVETRQGVDDLQH